MTENRTRRIQFTVLGGRASSGHAPDVGGIQTEEVVQPFLHSITRSIAYRFTKRDLSQDAPCVRVIVSSGGCD